MSGVASDDKIAALLETLLEVPHFRVSARYHYARALELTETFFWHQGRCPSYGEGVTFWALAEMVRMRCDIVVSVSTR